MLGQSLCIRTHTHTPQFSSLTGMGGLIRPLSPPKPGHLAQVAGMGDIGRLNLPRNGICPGRHSAIQMLCFVIARILAAFDILPPVDDNERPRIPELRYPNTFELVFVGSLAYPTAGKERIDPPSS
jgi:hypothetical protein